MLTVARKLNSGDPESVHHCVAFREVGAAVAPKAEEGEPTQNRTGTALGSYRSVRAAASRAACHVVHTHDFPVQSKLIITRCTCRE